MPAGTRTFAPAQPDGGGKRPAEPPPCKEEPAVPAAAFVARALTLAQYVAAYMRIPLVPLFARALGASTTEVGMINAGFMFCATVLSVPLGLVSDRLGKRRLIVARLHETGGRQRPRTNPHRAPGGPHRAPGTLHSLRDARLCRRGRPHRTLPARGPSLPDFRSGGRLDGAPFTSVGAVLSGSVETRVRGLAMGGYNTCIYGGMALPAATLGRAIEFAGCPVAFGLAGGVCALSALLFFLIFPRAGRTGVRPAPQEARPPVRRARANKPPRPARRAAP